MRLLRDTIGPPAGVEQSADAFEAIGARVEVRLGADLGGGKFQERLLGMNAQQEVLASGEGLGVRLETVAGG